MKAYKLSMRPAKKQAASIEKTLGCARFVHNHILSLKNELYLADKTNLSKYDAIKMLPALKKEHEWLKEVDSIALQCSVENLYRAFDNFFRGSGRPKYKKKYNDKSYTTKAVNDNIKVSRNTIVLPKLGSIKLSGAVRVEGNIKTATVTRDRTGEYSVSIVTDFEPEAMATTNKTVGIDLGLNRFAVLSNGQVYENQRHLKKHLDKLAKEQRNLARKKEAAKREGRKLEESKNYQKQRIKVARLHKKIANCRKDFNHKVSTEIVKNHDVICIETLGIKNMVKNRRLSRSISDVAWGQFIGMLEYKSDWYGRKLVKVDRFFASTQVCSNCGHSDGVKDLSVREWECSQCGIEHDRDLNAAINIHNEGLRLLAEAEAKGKVKAKANKT